VELLDIARDFFYLFSEFTYDGEGEVAWPEYLHNFFAFLEDADEFYEEEVNLLFSHTLHESSQ